MKEETDKERTSVGIRGGCGSFGRKLLLLFHLPAGGKAGESEEVKDGARGSGLE